MQQTKKKNTIWGRPGEPVYCILVISFTPEYLVLSHPSNILRPIGWGYCMLDPDIQVSSNVPEGFHPSDILSDALLKAWVVHPSSQGRKQGTLQKLCSHQFVPTQLRHVMHPYSILPSGTFGPRAQPHPSCILMKSPRKKKERWWKTAREKSNWPLGCSPQHPIF